MLVACLLASTVLLSSFLHGVQPSPACPADSVLQHLIPSGASQAQVTRPVTSISWSRGVTVSTLDSETSDRGSNPRRTSCPPRLLSFPTACFFLCPACCYLLLLLPFCRLEAISMLIACLLASTVLLSSFLHGVQPSPACPADSVLQHLISSGASQAQVTRPVTSSSWSRGVTVSTLDSESSDRGSNPRGTSCPPRLLSFPTACFFFSSCPLLSSPTAAILPPGSKQHAYRLPASFHGASFFLSSWGAALASAGTGPGKCHLRWNRI